ncbi:STAS domain-containing protein [Novosphingobium sp. MMS21-SN21R]|uniref:STAS domain-containing protein n=1 Tax=Novosphingobium sp. MMS21-SN21R TaxID=2969298 RepID=UPI00288564FB|nr:STAS domain-containing protein [Novosphingobium sp. MMS21-SN21R]MDT0506830.1 STAS domain-containing protein [Novosphingobium sp. MMS21-SN21R]
MSSISLPARCDRAAAEALLPELVAALGSGPLRIDGRECVQVGQAMLQLLVSARQTGDGAVIDPSSALREAVGIAGLSEELFGGVEA